MHTAKIVPVFFILAFVVSMTNAQTGVAVWTNRYNGTGNGNDAATCIATDNSGNVIVSGSAVDGSGRGLVTIKYSGTGAQLWTNCFKGPGNGGEANAVGVDGSGNVYVTGGSKAADAYNNYATLKYSSAGAPVWTNYFGGSGDDTAYEIAVTTNGFVYVTGIDNASGYATIKYSASGVPQWTNRCAGAGGTVSMAVDYNGNVFVAGQTNGNGNDFLTIKYSGSGTLLWTRRYDGGAGSRVDFARGLSVDRDGNIYVTGRSATSIGRYEMATLKYAGADGQPLWTNRVGYSGYDATPNDVALDGTGHILVAGMAGGNYATIKYSPFGIPLWTNLYSSGFPPSGVSVVAADGSNNVFVAGSSTDSAGFIDYCTIKYTGAGVPLWTNRYNGPGNGNDTVRAIALDISGNAFVAGYSRGSGSGDDYATIKYFGPSADTSDFGYTINNGAVTITNYTGAGGNVSIPSTINGYPVVAIGTNAFRGKANLTSADIPSSVTSIDYCAFRGCSGLTNVMIPNSVISIGNSAFESCNRLKILIIPDSVNNIGDFAFLFCGSLTSLTIGNSVTNVGDFAFSCCSRLTLLTIPDSVISIGCAAFSSCSSLTSLTIPNYVKTIGDRAFSGCSGLMSLIIGNSVTNIGYSAFQYCSSLTAVTVPASVTSIGDWAFSNCGQLQNIEVDAANLVYTSAGGVLFNKSMTTLIQLPGGIDGSYVVPDSVASLDDGAFSGCHALTSIEADPANLQYTSLGGVLFNKSMTALIRCPEGKTGSYVMPATVINIGYGAFSYCPGLTNVIIGDSAISIADTAFIGCSGLKNMTIPSNVKDIGRYAFASCTNLHEAYFHGDAPAADHTVFEGQPGTVHFLPGTRDWSDTFGGWPTAWWHRALPQILGSGHGLVAQSDGFRFVISWATNNDVVVEASTNLHHWTPVMTNALVNGINTFKDSTWSLFPQRFYRVRSP